MKFRTIIVLIVISNSLAFAQGGGLALPDSLQQKINSTKVIDSLREWLQSPQSLPPRGLWRQLVEVGIVKSIDDEMEQSNVVEKEEIGRKAAESRSGDETTWYPRAFF